MFDALRHWLRRWLLEGAAAPAAATTPVPADDPPQAGGHAAPRLVAYDEQLLERARVQWQFGDWSSVAAIERETLQHHPDRARLALLVGAAHMQLQQVEQGRQFLRLAQDYGCARKLVAQVLVSGVHNSLGRAAIANGQQERALRHFDRAIALGAPGGDARLLSQARANEQFTQLQAAGAALAARHAERLGLAFAPHPCAALPPGLAADFPQPGRRAAALAALSGACNALVPGVTMPAVDGTTVAHGDKHYHFAHFDGDYIPGEMRKHGKFYESSFLNLLARLHEPGRLIVDGGANLGNHSVFFAGVMKARVIAFEPQPHNHLLLCANRSLNQLDRTIDIRAKALGAHAGTVTLRLARENNYGTFSGAAPDAQGAPDAAPGFDVEVATLDDELAADADAISILKLDIEGMELDALRGAQQVLRRSKPLVAVECFHKAVYLDIKDFLAGFDYFLVESINATPTFIFLNKGNAFHMQALASHLERVSIGRLDNNDEFNHP